MDKQKITKEYLKYLNYDINEYKDFSEIGGFVFQMLDAGLIKPDEDKDLYEMLNNLKFKVVLEGGEKHG